MWDLAVREDDYSAVDTMLSRYAGAPLSYRVVPVYARGDSSARSRLFEEARNLDARQSQIAARYISTHLDDHSSAEAFARLDLQGRRNAGIRLGAQVFLAWLEIARDRWGAAREAFAAAAQMEGGSAVRVERAFAATLPFLDLSPSELEAIRSDILAWQPDSDAASPGSPPLANALRPHLRLYLLGLLSSKLGDAASARRYADELATRDMPTGSRSTVMGLVATVRGDVALRSKQPAEALRLLEPANGQVPLELVQTKAFASMREFTQEHARYIRAQALTALGRGDDARRWFETGFQGSPLELVYRPALERQGRLR